MLEKQNKEILKLLLFQTKIIENNVPKNLENYSKVLENYKENIDIIIFPELFQYGFSTNINYKEHYSISLPWMQQLAKKYKTAVVGGIAFSEENTFFNRMYFIEPNGKYFFYDKKHIFSINNEHKVFSQGNERVVVEYLGWKFLLQVCYDLRFPVFMRNRFKNNQFDYDAIILISNWPFSRTHHWKILSKARALENQAYFIGVNRLGTDDNNTIYNGNSLLIKPNGEEVKFQNTHKMLISATIDKQYLQNFRNKYPFYLDWDNFEIL